MDEARSRLVRSVLEDAFKADITIPMSAFPNVKESAIPLGLTAFDWGLLGIGGIPRGHFIEISGPEKAGKTTLLLHMIAAAQEADLTPLIIDHKGAVVSDVDRAERIGIDPDYAYMLPIKTTEDALARVRVALDKLKAKNLPIAIFWDDLGLTSTDAEMNPKQDKKTGRDNVKVGSKASAVWRFCRTLAGECFATSTPLAVVNQLTANIVTGYGAQYADTEITAGGGGLRYTARIRIELGKGKMLKKGKLKTGQVVYARTTANAFFPPQRSVALALNFVDGYDDSLTTLLNAEKANVVAKERGKYRRKGRGNKLMPVEDWTPGDLWEIEEQLWPWMSDGIEAYEDARTEDDLDADEDDDEEYVQGFEVD